MPSPSELPSVEADWNQWSPFSPPQSTSYVFVAFMVMAFTYVWSASASTLKGLPYVNPASFFSQSEARGRFRASAKDLLKNARKQYPNQPYRMVTDYGEVVILPSEFADEIRNEPKLSFTGGLRQEKLDGIPGFEPFNNVSGDGQLLQIVTKKQLTKLLSKVTEPLSKEAGHAIFLNMGESQGWQEITIKAALLDIVARMSSRVFLGDELCRNEAWLKITKEYTVDLFKAVQTLQGYPRYLRRYIHWFIPICKTNRAHINEARRVIAPVIAKRAEVKQAALAAGEKAPEFNDALDWVDDEAAARGCKYDAATFQMMLSMVAIHTTTDLLQTVMLHLAEHPESFQPVREEIVSVLRAEGWNKTALYNMKLLDSLIKESQRVKPIGSALMRRKVEEDLTLSNGVVLRKGTRLHVDMHRMHDPQVYENPESWDPRRFLDMRSQPGKEHMAQLVATSGDHIGFGRGEHACPGRFFAANELKVALCHLLIKYEWKLAPGTDTRPLCLGLAMMANPAARLVMRRREQVEFDIDSI